MNIINTGKYYERGVESLCQGWPMGLVDEASWKKMVVV